MRRNVEFVAEAYTHAGVLFAVEHFNTEEGARAAALALRVLDAVAYVDVAEKWEEPTSSARSMTDIPVVYRYITRMYRDREEALTTVMGQATVHVF